MLGAFAVGKTSLIQRYVNSIFSEKYHTTIGVKIDQKLITIDQNEVNLLLWDIHGEDDYQKVKPTYLMGASGYFIVIDGCRKSTLDTALHLQKMAQSIINDKPFYILINKSDLKEEWEIEEEDIQRVKENGWKIIETSAKEGFGVEKAFQNIVRDTLNT